MHLLHFFLSEVASLNSARFIPVLSCISSIRFFLGRRLFFFPSPQANIIFSSPSARMTCPKNPSFLRNAICCNDSSFSIPISMRTPSFVFFSIQDILSIFLHIHISQALIFFLRFFVIVHVSQPYSTVGKINALTSLFFVSILTCLSLHIFSRPIIAALPMATLRLISNSHLPSFSIIDPRNVKLFVTSISSPSNSNLSHSAVVMIFVFFMLKYRPACSLSFFSLLINSVRSSLIPAISVVSSAYLKLFSVLPAILTPSVASSISALLIILSAYRLNRTGDKMHPCLTPFLILNLSVSPNSVLITATWSSYSPLSSCIKCFGIPISISLPHQVVV